MSGALVERKLFEVAERLRRARDHLEVVEEQLRALEEAAEECRLEALVADTPAARREYAEAKAHAEVMSRSRQAAAREVQALAATQEELFGRLMEADPFGSGLGG